MPPLWLYTWPMLIIIPLSHDPSDSLHWCRNLGSMATGDRVCLPKHLDDGDARSWFKRYELYVAANEWNEAKNLLRLPKLFKGWAWAIYESLGNSQKDTYAHLKGAMMERLNLDTDENCMVAREQLMLRQFREEVESVDGLVQDLERMLYKSSPGLPAEIREADCGSTL